MSDARRARRAGMAGGLALALLTGCADAEPARAPRVHTVEIRGFDYVPATLTVAAGDTVVWVNRDIVPHTATAEGAGWDSGSLAADGSWRLEARGEGEQPYVCTFHPGMAGVLVVE